MRKQIFSLLLLGILCSIGNVWADNIVWQSDMQSSIANVTQAEGRASDDWSTELSLSWASGYTKGYNCGGSSSSLTLTFNSGHSLSLKKGNTIRIIWGCTNSTSRTLSLFINDGGEAVKTQSSVQNSLMICDYELSSDVTLNSFKMALTNSAVYIFKVIIIGEKPTDGSTIISYIFRYKSGDVQGITDNCISNISNISSTISLTGLSTSGSNGVENCSGQIIGQAATDDGTKYADLQFTVADGYTFTPSSISFSWRASDAALKAKIKVLDATTTVTSEESTVSANTNTAISFASGAFTGKKFSGTVHIRVFMYGKTGVRGYLVSPFTITGTVAAASYAISFSGNGNTGGEMTNITGISSGNDVDALTENAFTKTGHNFTGWKTNTALTYVAYGSEDIEANRTSVTVNGNVPDKAKIKNITSDIALTAQWSPATYTITLNKDGGTINSGNVTSYTYGEGATLPTDITKSGYEFVGWYDNDGLTGDPVEAISAEATGDKEFWANWVAEPTKYDITFDKGAYSAYDGAVSFPVDENTSNVTLIELTSDDSYRFDGWKADVDVKETTPTGSTISAGTLIDAGTKVYVTDVTTFTAQWTEKFAVTFNSNGGSSVVTQYVISGGTAEEPTAPERTNYTFQGWQLNGADYNFATTISAPITLDAIWERNNIGNRLVTEDYTADTENGKSVTSASSYSATSFSFKKIDNNSYSIAKDKSDATSSDSKTFSYGFLPGNQSTSSQGFQLTASKDISSLDIYYTMSDSKFTSDDQNKSGNLIYKINTEDAVTSSTTGDKSNKTAYLETISNIEKNDVVKIYSSASRLVIFALYATYSADPYTVTLKVKDQADEVINVTSGETLGNIFVSGTLPTPSVTGYTFNGWKNEDGNAAVNNNTVISGSMVIYADLTGNDFAVTLHRGTNGAADGAATAIMGETSLTITTAATAASGYGLLGYFTAADNDVKVAEADGTLIEDVDGWTNADGEWIKASDADLYAQWNLLAAPTSITITGAGSYAKNAEATLTVTDVDGAPAPSINWYSCDSDGHNLSAEPVASDVNSYSPSTTTAGVFYFVAVATNSQGSCQSAVQTVTVKPATPSISKGNFNFANTGYAVTLTNNEESGDLKIKVGATDWAAYSAAVYATTTTTYKAKVVLNGAESDIAELEVENTFDGEKKYIAWVYTKGYGSASYAFATDPMVIALQSLYNVVEMDLSADTDPTSATDIANADLIVCSEAMTGNKTLSNKMKTYAGSTPMIGLKAFNYTKGRWSWGTPANPSSTTTTFTPKSALYKLFNGVTFEAEGKIKLATASSGNVVQTVEFGTTDCTAPTGNTLLGTLGTDATAVMYASNKYFGLGLSSDCWATYTPNAVVIVKNAAAMLIAGEALNTEVVEVAGTITACGYSTFSSSYPLDLDQISGGTAYFVSSITDSKAVLAQATGKVPSGTGLLIKGDANADFTIEVTSDATSASGSNLLVGAPSGTTVAAANNTSEWNYVFGWTDPAAPGFYLIDELSANLSAGKAYLHTTNALSVVSGEGAPSLIRIIEEENNATDINTIDANVEAVKFFENGQLLIQKNGVVYDAIGRIIRK